MSIESSSQFKTAIVKSVKRTLINSEIKALPTTRIELVTGKANKIICPIYAFALLDATAGAYTIPSGAAWQLYWGPTLSREASAVIDVSDVSGDASRLFFQFPALFGIGSGDFLGYLITTKKTDANIGASLYIADHFNGVIDYTGGNDNNTLDIHVLYTILDV